MKIGSRTWFAVAGVLPCALLFWFGAVYVWNHFVGGPLLLDAGWFSATVWRAGILPQNPTGVIPTYDFFDMHIAPIVSIGSMLSYLAPIGRVRWYAVYQGAIYMPLGCAVALLVGRDGQRATLSDALIVALASVAFATNGQVLACVGYPHFELFMLGGFGIMLAALATGRSRLAWVGLAFCILTREDGGLHAALFLLAVLASDLTGVPFPVHRRTVFVMAVTAFFTGVAFFAIQKMFFKGGGLFEHEYLGRPPYAHVTVAEVRTRLHAFFERSGWVWFPLVTTTIFAVYKRDPRWLLGWAAQLPWLLLNFFAAQVLKATFDIYTGFPFVGSIFWVGAYARVRAKQPTHRAWLVPLVVVSLQSTLGVLFLLPGSIEFFVTMGSVPRTLPVAVERYFEAVARDSRAQGNPIRDPSVGSWTIESVRWGDLHPGPHDATFDGHDSAVFYLNGLWHADVFALLGRSPFNDCAHVVGSDVWHCTRAGGSHPDGFRRGNPRLLSAWTSPLAHREGDTVRIDPVKQLQVDLGGPLFTLDAGAYVAKWRVRQGPCTDAPIPRLKVTVEGGGAVLASKVLDEEDPLDLEVSDVEGATTRLALPFTIAASTENLDLRTWSGRCGWVVEDVVLEPAP